VNEVKVIGIAGASGTGKSTVAAHLAARGGVHVDADAVAHDLLERDADVIAAVRARFGAGVFGDDGRIDRRLLGAKVFADPALLSALGAITHGARADGAPFVVVDAALLLDAAMPFRFDLVIALRARAEERFRRILARGGRSEHEVRSRMAGQRGIEKSFYKADVVVDTDGDREVLLEKIDELVDGVLGRADGEEQ
jgi:dephospho-CoA kinase